ncbi:MAG: hypothetical protein ABI461_06455 [Polyangiaceae bacterium]
MVFLYSDAGSVFVAGKTKEVAGISQSTLECDDNVLREALQSVTGSLKKRKKIAAKKKK